MRGPLVFLGLLALCGAFGVAVWLTVWTEWAGPLYESVEFTASEASEFAERHTQADCIPAALDRHRHCTGSGCNFHLGAFTQICLSQAAPTPGLCTGVPRSLADSAPWAEHECAEQGLATPTCAAIVQQLVIHCSDEDE